MKPQKPTKDTLNKNYILNTALDLIDKDTLSKFNMRKLGKEMGVSQMAVYRYFDSQGALFDDLVELIWKKALLIRTNSPKNTWQEQLINSMAQLRQALLKHPNVLPLISTHPLVTQTQFALIEDILNGLKTKGLEIQPTTVFLINSLTAYTLGFVWTEAIEPKNGGKPDLQVLENIQKKSDILNLLLSPLQDKKFTSDEQFQLGIKALINGWK